MTDKPIEERRQYERYFKSVPLTYEVERDGAWVPGTGQLITVDMSAGGAKVRCEEPVRVGSRLALSMTLEGAHFSTLATVVWVSPSRVEGHTIAGLRFEDLGDDERGSLDKSLRDKK
jgi:c-di-GMP-binding flagellar brake protein YcgR